MEVILTASWGSIQQFEFIYKMCTGICLCVCMSLYSMVYMKTRGLHTPLECQVSVDRKYEIIIHVIFMGFA